MTIEVKVSGRGTVRDGDPSADGATTARCALCERDVDTVVSVTPAADVHACKDCLRQRLEATTVAQWLLRDPAASGLPWGKFSG